MDAPPRLLWRGGGRFLTEGAKRPARRWGMSKVTRFDWTRGGMGAVERRWRGSSGGEKGGKRSRGSRGGGGCGHGRNGRGGTRGTRD